jgi:mannose-6-phosphate isomerase-like protein (cupin superfamily)
MALLSETGRGQDRALRPAHPSDTLTAGVFQSLHGRTRDLSYLDVHTHTLAPKQSFTLPADNSDHLIIIRQGRVTAAHKTLGPGGVGLFPAGDKAVLHSGSAKVIFDLFSIRSRSAVSKAGPPLLIDWPEMPMKKTDKGESRQIFSRPLINIHATTLDAGEISHPQHVHRNEEIIVMRSGHVRMHIAGYYVDAQGGDVVFLPSGVPHDLENGRGGRCEYFALQWAPVDPVEIRYDSTRPASAYAARRLSEALRDQHAPLVIRLAIDSSHLQKEAYSIQPDSGYIDVTGGDDGGLLYGSLTLARLVATGTPLEKMPVTRDQPNFPFRAIKFDLPWDTYRHSYALDQHYATCRDTLFWKAFLDMMADNRFNALCLCNLHPYPYMIRARNFPEACPFSDGELKEWQTLFRSIFRMAKERGIETYLVPFNIFVSPEFARAHGVALNNLQHHFFVDGDTSGIIRRYTRESVTQVLQEYPDLTGFGLTLGEGMGGMTPQQREDWMKETIIAGMHDAGRRTKLIHRIPFSSGTGSLGVTSIATERLTRKAMVEEGNLDFLEPPVWADLKYNWSHAFSTTKLIKVHGGKLNDTYFKPPPQNYKIVWTARNEDFFCLRWGAPEFIREHIRTNSQPYAGGYIIGSETYIPAKDYFTNPDLLPLAGWKYAFQRQWLFYMLWGRLLYDPDTPDSVFRQEFVHRYGKRAAPMLDAYALVSKTPLLLASYFDFTWDFTLYSEGFMALDTTTKSVGYISVDRLIRQPVTDPAYISVKGYVDSLEAHRRIVSHITPLQLADSLEDDCYRAARLYKDIQSDGTPALLYELTDLHVWTFLGLHFAHQLNGAVALEKFRRDGDTAAQRLAIRYLQQALDDWDQVIHLTRPLYNDMPLTHLSEQNGVRSPENARLRWHWAMMRAAVARDVEIARTAKPLSP